MKITLKDGKEVRVGCRHTRLEDGRRATEAWLKWQDEGGQEQTLVACAVCSREDNFNKRLGRKLAAQRLLDSVRSFLEKDSRARIFRAICPDLTAGGKR